MYIVLDTETTGLVRPDGAKLELQPRIIELAAVRLDENYNEIGRIDQMINPGIPIPELITKITGIKQAMVNNQPTFADLYPDIAELFLGVRWFVAQNATFDQSLLIFDLQRIGKARQFPWPINIFCTVEQSMHITGHRLKLGELYRLATGKEISGAHRAMNDVKATIEVFKWLKRAIRKDPAKRKFNRK